MRNGEKLLCPQKKKKKTVPGFKSVWFESLRCWRYVYKQLISYCHLESWSHSSTLMRKFCAFSVTGVLWSSAGQIFFCLIPEGIFFIGFNKCRNVPNLWPVSLALHQRVNLPYYYYFCAWDHWRKLKSTFHIYIMYIF